MLTVAQVINGPRGPVNSAGCTICVFEIFRKGRNKGNAMSKIFAVAALLLSSMSSFATVLTEFLNRDSDVRWRVVNDNVMGGRSLGDFVVQNEKLLFTGSTNTRGGGFSSIRSVSRALGISDANEGLELLVRGDGRTYIFRVQTSAGVTYWAEFPTFEEWTSTRIPFSDFEPRWRGRSLNGPVLKPSDIVSVGLMIYDGRDGAFSLNVDKISAF